MGHKDIRLTPGPLRPGRRDDLKQRANDDVAARLIGTRDKRAMAADSEDGG